MKVFAVLVLFLAGLVPVRADTQTWNVTASCQDSPYPGCALPANINAVFTTQLETGVFTFSQCFCAITGTEPVVTNITGTFDGLPMTFVPTDPSLGFNWLLVDGAFAFPEGIIFTAGGIQYSLVEDIGHELFWNGGFEFLNWSAIDPAPEPPMVWLLLTGLLLLLLYRKHNRSSFSVHR